MSHGLQTGSAMVLIAMGGSASWASAATYSLTDLDTVGGLQSYAFSLNNQGKVVGYRLLQKYLHIG